MFSPEFMKFLVNYNVMDTNDNKSSIEKLNVESNNIVNFRYARLATAPVELKISNLRQD